jgi:hypothetical protein
MVSKPIDLVSTYNCSNLDAGAGTESGFLYREAKIWVHVIRALKLIN